MIIVVLKSFKFWKYRWVKIQYADGSRMVGAMTNKMFKELTIE